MIIWKTQQYLKGDRLYLSHYFTFSYLLSFPMLSYTKEHYVHNLYFISYALNFCWVMYYRLSRMYIGGRYLEDWFYFYSQQIIFTEGNESFILKLLLLYHQIFFFPFTFNKSAIKMIHTCNYAHFFTKQLRQRNLKSERFILISLPAFQQLIEL